MPRPKKCGTTTEVSQASAVREAAREAMIELASAEAALQRAVESARREFRYEPNSELEGKISSLAARQRELTAAVQRRARNRADHEALPNSKFWRKVYDEFVSKHLPPQGIELEQLRTEHSQNKERAFREFLSVRAANQERWVIAARGRRESARKAVIAAFNDALCNAYVLSDEARFVDPADGELAGELRVLRRRHVQAWARARLRGLEIDDEQADAVGVVGRHVKLTARAGSGKTRTLTVRAAFLIDRCGVQPSELMLLAFNRKAAAEMADRLKDFGIVCPQVMTFHAFARAIVKPAERILTDGANEHDKSGRITEIIQQWVETDLGDHRAREVMLRYYRTDWEKIFLSGIVRDKSAVLRHIRTAVPNETLDGKQVRSFGEKVISNFLFEHDVPYKYEPVHRWNGDVYRPDFEITGRRIVIEYFGMSHNPEYRKQMSEKREYWRSKGWTLLEYDPSTLDGDLSEALPIALAADLERLRVPLRARSDDELWHARGRQLRLEISDLIAQLIGRCRKALLTPEAFATRLRRHSPVDSIEADVLGLLSEAYAAYVIKLADGGEDDFEGLLQRAIAMIRAGAWEFGRRDLCGDVRRLRHLLVDEFQDVAPLFWGLVEAVRDASSHDVEVFGVGDDWQAINGFAGSSPRFLLEFETLLNPTSSLGLLTNYRSTRSVVEVGNAIMSGRGEPARAIPRAGAGRVLVADLGSFKPTFLEDHHWRGDSATPALRRLIAGPIADGKTVAVLARQRFSPYPLSDRTVGQRGGAFESPRDLDRLRRLVCEGLDAKSRELVVFETVHGFKGREADFVLILDAVQGRFPKVHPNWIFGRVFGDSLEGLLEDERRLFYVGCSRAASTLVVLTEESRVCSFLQDVEHRFTPLSWDSLPQACPRDGDWVLVIDGDAGEDSSPTFHRRDSLKARGFSFFGSDRGATWHLRVRGAHSLEELSGKISDASWFPGPAGLRIRFMHGDGVTAGEYVLVREADAPRGLRIEPRRTNR